MNKIFLLFGASGKLGQEAISYFLNCEYDYYYFFSRKKLELPSTEKKCENIIVGDLADESKVIEAFNKIRRDSDSYYYLFDTIGTYWGGKRIDETPYEEWKKLIDINLNTSFLIAREFMRLVASSKGGSICFTSAFTSLSNEAGIAAYGTSKNALNYFVKTLAEEGKSINLNANAIAPYILDTESNRQWIDDKNKLIPLKELCIVVENIFESKKIFTGNIIFFSESLKNS
ncbi:SDR family NAD(P)-dependent oxidoreductase [Melioribacter sp. OK-6-Me]|uniref:SDR family NAD(P)-dependent oxidoreductase n=1 Tax=unclassified Melioribacter TaxID=2627329 RepID=UPI003EDA59DE